MCSFRLGGHLSTLAYIFRCLVQSLQEGTPELVLACALPESHLHLSKANSSATLNTSTKPDEHGSSGSFLLCWGYCLFALASKNYEISRFCVSSASSRGHPATNADAEPLKPQLHGLSAWQCCWSVELKEGTLWYSTASHGKCSNHWAHQHRSLTPSHLGKAHGSRISSCKTTADSKVAPQCSVHP